MELIKKNIHMNRRKGRTVSRISLDEDQNVPDSKADIEKIIQEKSEVLVEEVRPAADHVLVRGALVYDLLYMDNENMHRIHNMHGKIYFEESVHIDGISDQDNVCVEWEYEVPHVTIINSRKINFRTLLSLTVTIDEIYDEEVVVDVHDSAPVQRQCKNVPLLQMKASKKDVIRIHNQWQLPSDKPNVQEVLFYTITPKGVRLTTESGCVRAVGELQVFLLYVPEGDDPTPHWLEYGVPFDDKADCSGADSAMIGDLHWEASSRELDIKPDGDGEERVAAVSCVLELSVKLYEEEQVEMVTDVYATDRELTPRFRQVPFTQLLVKNESKCRTNKRMKVTDSQSRVLQICHSEGAVKTEHTQIVENGIKLDGTLSVQILYITADDAQPFRLAKGSIPFSHVIDAPDISKNCVYHIYPVLEQLGAGMVDSEEMEIKAVISMDTIVFDRLQEPVIDEIAEAPLDFAKLQEMPGITGYAVHAGDTLWEIARTHYTTKEELMTLNGLEEETLKPGQQLVILKSVMRA